MYKGAANSEDSGAKGTWYFEHFLNALIINPSPPPSTPPSQGQGQVERTHWTFDHSSTSELF